MRAVLTVGLGFGDEGKGAAVDSLTRELAADVVVRYSGGAQAGHNVQLPDGRRHTFSQFCAGTFAGAKSYIGSRVIISPSTMVPEAEHLARLGVDDPWSQLTVHSDCLVSCVYHMLMNRLRELARGNDRHGSCGLGMGETRQYWLRHGQDAIFAGDLHDQRTLLQKLTLLRERLLLEMQELPALDRELSGLLHGTMPIDEARVLQQATDRLQIGDRMPPGEVVIFEGAQGVLLDEWRGFHPHTTWSTVTPQHAFEMLCEYDVQDAVVLGITRAYSNRHGAGPFPTSCQRMTAELLDRGNPENRWQGAIRFGPLDLVLAEYAARACPVDGLIVSCLDQLSARPRICQSYREIERIEIPQSLQEQQDLTVMLESCEPVVTEVSKDELLEALGQIAPVVGTSHGATFQDLKFGGIPESSGKLTRDLTRSGPNQPLSRNDGQDAGTEAATSLV